MKSSLLKSALVAVVGLALCAPVAALAQTNAVNNEATSPVKNPPMEKTAKSKKTNDQPSYKGTVKSIDATSIVVTDSKGQDMTLAINDMTKVKVDKKKAKASDVTAGEMVTGSYKKDASGSMTACSIHAKSK